MEYINEFDETPYFKGKGSKNWKGQLDIILSNSNRHGIVRSTGQIYNPKIHRNIIVMNYLKEGKYSTSYSTNHFVRNALTDIVEDKLTGEEAYHYNRAFPAEYFKEYYTELIKANITKQELRLEEEEKFTNIVKELRSLVDYYLPTDARDKIVSKLINYNKYKYANIVITSYSICPPKFLKVPDRVFRIAGIIRIGKYLFKAGEISDHIYSNEGHSEKLACFIDNLREKLRIVNESHTYLEIYQELNSVEGLESPILDTYNMDYYNKAGNYFTALYFSDRTAIKFKDIFGRSRQELLSICLKELPHIRVLKPISPVFSVKGTKSREDIHHSTKHYKNPYRELIDFITSVIADPSIDFHLDRNSKVDEWYNSGSEDKVLATERNNIEEKLPSQIRTKEEIIEEFAQSQGLTLADLASYVAKNI